MTVRQEYETRLSELPSDGRIVHCDGVQSYQQFLQTILVSWNYLLCFE